MNTKTISESEIADLKISSLPTRPTSSRINGGRGFSANEMKAAFDNLPLFIIKRLNSLIEDIEGNEDGSLISSLKTGISEEHTLKDLFEEISSGEFINRLSIENESLTSYLCQIKSECEEIKRQIDEFFLQLEFPDTTVIDLGTVSDGEKPYSLYCYRGTREEWENSAIILADGEIATEINENGVVRFKIGNGKNTYPDLKYVGTRVVGPEVINEYNEVHIENGLDIHLGEIEYLTLIPPTVYDDDFSCRLSFESNDNFPLFNCGFYDFNFSGSDFDGMAFTPMPNMHYTIFFYNGGRSAPEAIIRGISREPL